MSIEIKIPAVGESITEAMIDEWLIGEGDWIAQDESIAVIETDKASMEIPAPESGTLTKILKQEGDNAEIGEVIAHFEPGEQSGTAPPKKTAAPSKPAPATTDAASESSTRTTPASRRALAEAGLDAADVAASGPRGHVLKEDVQRHASQATTTASPAPTADATPAAPTSARQEEAVKMSPLRKTVARRLVEAQQTAALLTTFNEVDMSRVMEMRRAYKADFLEKHGVKPGFMSFFVKATIEALKEVPAINAEIRDQQIIYRNYYDIGVAIGGGKGLVVPVIRNAERLSFAEIEKAIGDFAVRAKSGKIGLAELQGGTFTISNGGIYGSLLSTPIVNPPQSGILGMHKIEERPVAVNGEVVIRPMMYLAVTYDHRLVDGREAVTFLVKIKERLEDPSRILLEV